MAKKSGHSAEKVAGIYGVNKSRVEAFLIAKGKKATDRIFGPDNTELARFISKSPISLSGKKKKRKTVEVIKPIKISPKFLAWERAKSAKYQEQIDLNSRIYKEEFIGKDYSGRISKLRQLLPSKESYLESLKPKYFLLEDIQVRSGVVKVDPNKQMVTFCKIQPFEGDEAFVRKVIRKKHNKQLYKVFYNDQGKAELNGSSDWLRIKQVVEDSVEHKRRDPSYMVATPSKSGTNRIQEFNIQDLSAQVKKSIYLRLLVTVFTSSNKAVVLKEFNNGTLEDAILLVGTRNSRSIIFWENLNEARATYVFYSKRLSQQALKSYVINLAMRDEFNKRRSLFSAHYVPNLSSISYSSINHDGLKTFEEKVKTVLVRIANE
jgi:hypothetical protein